MFLRSVRTLPHLGDIIGENMTESLIAIERDRDRPAERR